MEETTLLYVVVVIVSDLPQTFFFHQCKRHRFDAWGQEDVLE